MGDIIESHRSVALVLSWTAWLLSHVLGFLVSGLVTIVSAVVNHPDT